MSVLVVDVLRHEVSVDSCAVHLTPTEFAMLLRLVTADGRVVHRDQLARAAGQFMLTIKPVRRTIDAHIYRIRRKLGELADDRKGLRYIAPVYSLGYCCRASLTVRRDR